MHNDPAPGIWAAVPWVGPLLDKGPTEGNHRLTALTGALLVPLLGLIFLTGLFMDAYWHVHYVIGFVLIPVVALKLASTGYRMTRYYLGNPVYRASGPPELLPRVMAPIMVLSVVMALVTGVLLFVQQSRHGILSTLHTDSAVATALLVGVHMLTYVPDAAVTIAREFRARLSRPATMRITVAAIALVAGIVLAGVTYSSGVWPARPFGQRFGGLGIQSGPRIVAATAAVPQGVRGG
jgi:hypothetical protein